MAIQINQHFPHCARCGIMLHSSQDRIAARADDGRPLVFCSALCRDEYVELNGLADPGELIPGVTNDAGRKVAQ